MKKYIGTSQPIDKDYFMDVLLGEKENFINISAISIKGIENPIPIMEYTTHRHGKKESSYMHVDSQIYEDIDLYESDDIFEDIIGIIDENILFKTFHNGKFNKIEKGRDMNNISILSIPFIESIPVSEKVFEDHSKLLFYKRKEITIQDTGEKISILSDGSKSIHLRKDFSNKIIVYHIFDIYDEDIKVVNTFGMSKESYLEEFNIPL